MRFAVLLTLILAAGSPAAPAPFLPRPRAAASPEADMKLMLGLWHRVSCTYGRIPPVPNPLNDSVEFSPGKIKYNDGSGAVWNLTLGVEGGKKTWDIHNSSTRWLGLYEMDAETLRVCFTNNKERPISITPTKPGEHLQTFKRKKP